MKNLWLKLLDSLIAKLGVAAKQRGVSKSVLARKALEAYLVEVDGPPGLSCFELGKEFWGSVEGPGDLSHNPKYMEGYGI